MEDHLNSSEAFAKALKGFQIPPTEKIRLAQEAWRRVDVVLPHKQEFLLEWLCSSLLKSATPGKGVKDAASNVLLDLEYWELFRDMLAAIANSRKKNRHLGTASTGIRHHGLESGVTESQAAGVLLRVPTVPIFTAVIQKLLPQTSTASVQPTADSATTGTSKQKKKSKAQQSQAVAIQDNNSSLPSMAVIDTVKLCLELLCGPFMSEWFQPTLEQYTPLVQATLEAMVDLNRIKSLDTEAVNILLDLGFVVLDRFRRLVVVQPNQKKVFTLLAGPMFEALVGARFSIKDSQERSGRMCQEAIGHTMRSGLFHQEHLQEYTSGYNATGGVKSLQSYQKQLFDHIAEMAKSSSSASVLDVLPVLLSYFVEETRRKQRALASSGFDRGIESAREIEFEFFKIVYILAQKELPSLGEDASEKAVIQLADIMEALNLLLSTLLDLNMYQPSNNEEADQYVFMSTSFQSLYSCLMSARRLSNGRLQSISLHGIVVLSQLDDRLLKPHLDSLWPTLLRPLEQAQDAALELGKTLLEIYGKSSDFKTFLTSFLTALREFVTRPEDLRMSPMFSRQFLDLIPSNIRSHLPLPQSPTILDIFVGELMALDSSLDQLEGLDLMAINGQVEEEETDKKKKKRKLNSGKSKSAAAADSSLPSAELVTMLFIQFLKGLRVTTNQEKQLNKEFEALYQHFLKQIFDRVASSSKGSDGQVSEIFQSRRLTPALQLHYALCKVSTKYWAQGMSMDLVKKIVRRLTKSLTDWTDAVVLTMNRVILQHVHLTLCSSQTTVMEETQAQQCQELVQFTMKSSRLEGLVNGNGGVSKLSVASWDGRLEHATGDQFLVASWQIQVNDWLDIVCRFGQVQDMNLIATVIAGHFSQQAEDCNNREGQDKFSTQITIHLLNQILLRSANFYEVPNFRQIFAQKILQELSSSITLLSGTDAEKALAATVSTFTSGDAATTTAKVAYQDALKELVEVSRQQGQSGTGKKGASKSSKSPKIIESSQGSHLLSLLSIMHLLPLEYFEKFERNIILTTMAVLDYYIPRYLSVESSNIGLKCLLLERRISNAIMTWRMDAGVLCFDSQILLNLLVPYPAWNCTSKVGHEDNGGYGQATLQTSSLMLEHTVRYLMTQFQQQPHFAAQLDVLLTSVLQSWAQSSDVIESSSWTVGAMSSGTKGQLQLSESRIKFVLLSQACQSLVQGLEGLHQHRSKSRSKKAKADNSSMDLDQKSDETAALEVKIDQLFDVVQTKSISRIGKSLALLKPLTKRDALTRSALECMDHIELYKTLVQYRQLKSSEHSHLAAKKTASKTSKQGECLDLVESLFHLAQALAHEIHERQHHSQHDKEEGLEHLAAVLTAYSCEYLPKSSAWPKQEQGNGSFAKSLEKQLLELLVRISGQQHGQMADAKDVAMLKDAYLILLGQLTETQFESLLQWLLEERVVVGASGSSADTAVEELILVRYLDVTFLSAHHKQKRLVRRQISKLLTRSIQILQSTTSVDVVVAVLDLMAGICSESSFELRSWEVGLVLEGITSLMSPATPLLHPVFGDLSRGETPAQLRNQDTTRIFTSLYHVLMNVTRFRQEELTSLIPVFMAILQGCLHGFKSLHGSIAKRQQGLESLVKSPFMLLSAGVLAPVSAVATGVSLSKTVVASGEKAAISGEKHAAIDKFAPAPVTVVMGDPLPVECAENFSRLLTALGSKGVVSHHQQHQQQQQQQQQQENAVNGISSSTSSGFTTVSADASKAFGKHAPYLLMEYFTIQCSVVASIRSLELRNALLPGLYGLLNLCSEWEREMMMVGLDNTGKTLLKGLYSDYLKYYKYTGQ
ncbi:nucleolar pre-ribosomal-associated protein 2 [Entomortierella parvispora]|uniref:Nucleolar pre-ribosomal-associated protein 2 n=1 Tax=Entomortierella parvispora TaxID=205924 RepID=A0A9P3H9F2_9FUNG|nr:nucleolar pre-ribosomal-associated protein 2 [Entomortierella parvispora]